MAIAVIASQCFTAQSYKTTETFKQISYAQIQMHTCRYETTCIVLCKPVNLFYIPQEITTQEVAEYSEQYDMCTQQTSSSWETVNEQDLEEEKFEMHCQETIIVQNLIIVEDLELAVTHDNMQLAIITTGYYNEFEGC